jgi:hypothetical protein
VIVYEAPEYPVIGPEQRHTKKLFLAGGITDCPDWQAEVIADMEERDLDLIVFNPRRADFPIGDVSAAEKQIQWEHDYLREAQAILFWFPCETLCPIVLYELGTWTMQPKPIFVGIHPDYQRRQDVEIQTWLARPQVPIVYDLAELVRQVRDWVRS